jgi:hypothetical protein
MLQGMKCNNNERESMNFMKDLSLSNPALQINMNGITGRLYE